ncbi:hypothetical protein ABEG18_16060 [Alsobacter sp. KACC 23698]|uniref:Uncharacterized protein n=1 Tax=Alsobacter sp. KACC 23698 TaxID=3149229 RepID=A0AAU7JAB6_9HYPH
MMRTLLSTAAILAMGSAGLAAWQPAQGSDDIKLDLMASLHGRCTAIVVAGKEAACSPKAGVLVTRLKNNRTLVMIGMADGKSALTFVGEGPRTSAADLPDLRLSRVYVGSSPDAPHIDVDGACSLSRGPDGKALASLSCEAKDGAGARYSLQFETAGAPPDIQRF